MIDAMCRLGTAQAASLRLGWRVRRAWAAGPRRARVSTSA